MKITLDVVKEVAKGLNESFKPEPPIKINTKSTIASLTEEIRATIDILEKGDVLSEKVADILSELQIDVPAAVKIGDAKKETKKITKSTKEKKENAGPSNKAVCYLEWKKNNKVTIESLSKKTNNQLKEVTIKIWLKQWSQGKNLPAIANK